MTSVKDKFFLEDRHLYYFVQSKYPYHIEPSDEIFGHRLPPCEEFNSKYQEYSEIIYCVCYLPTT